MSSIQPCPVLESAPRAANRPFTRAHNDLYDTIKPGLYHKVDRSVLDALIRCLEGYHQSWVALPIPQLANLAAVSPWSATKALARLEAAGVIHRRKQKLTQAGRFIWQISLAEPFRVASSSMGPSHGTTPCDGPMAMKENLEKKAKKKDHHHAVEHATEEPVVDWPIDDASSKIATFDEGPPAEPLSLISTEPLWPIALSSAIIDEESACEIPVESPDVSTERKQALQILLSVGIDLWKARRLAKSHPLPVISQAVESLKYRNGTVRNPAAWIIREIERGGYAPPPALAERARRDQEQAAKAMQQLQEEERQAAIARSELERTQRLLEHFAGWPPERKEALVHQVRERLRKVSPRLAQAPLELDTPGPIRSQLLELLEQAELSPRLAGPTPRSGGWTEQRRGFSPPLQEPRSTCATTRDG